MPSAILRDGPAHAPVPFAGSPAAPGAESLCMIGIQLEGALGPARGPALRYADPREFRRLRRSRHESIALMQRAASELSLRECWAWNTCARSEVYAWLAPTRQAAPALALLADLAFHGARTLNLLSGHDAQRHLLRSASGLNSHLIGDADVVDQLDGARRAAHVAGTAGPLTASLIDGVIRSVHGLRRHTLWGSFQHRYCATALAQLAPRLPLSGHGARVLVIGGSTTS